VFNERVCSEIGNENTLRSRHTKKKRESAREVCEGYVMRVPSQKKQHDFLFCNKHTKKKKQEAKEAPDRKNLEHPNEEIVGSCRIGNRGR